MQIDPVCAELFEQFKLRGKPSWIVFKLSDDLTKILVDKVAAEEQTFYDLLAALPNNAPRYIVLNFTWDQGQLDGKRVKSVFVYCCPTESPPKQKMMSAMWKEKFRRTATVGVNINVEIDSKNSLTNEFLLERCTRFNKS